MTEFDNYITSIIKIEKDKNPIGYAWLEGI